MFHPLFNLRNLCVLGVLERKLLLLAVDFPCADSPGKFQACFVQAGASDYNFVVCVWSHQSMVMANSWRMKWNEVGQVPIGRICRRPTVLVFGRLSFGLSRVAS